MFYKTTLRVLKGPSKASTGFFEASFREFGIDYGLGFRGLEVYGVGFYAGSKRLVGLFRV